MWALAASGREPEELALAITTLFSVRPSPPSSPIPPDSLPLQAIDSTRAAIQYLETIIFESGTELAPHSLEIAPAASAHGHIHESDYLSQAIRLDRDLLDLFSMVTVMLEKLPGVGLPGLLGDAKGRVRKGLKTQAFYCKVSEGMGWGGGGTLMVFGWGADLPYGSRCVDGAAAGEEGGCLLTGFASFQTPT